MRPNEESPLAQDILSYLLTHTAAEDTVEGIVEWWLLEEKIKRRTKEVQRALDELAAEGLIVARESKDSRIHYRLNKRKMNRIRAILRSEFTKKRG
jgi:predicted transcriptional regulator